MKQVTTYVGIDAHKRDLFVAMLVGPAPTPVTWQLANEAGAVRRMVRKLERTAPGPVHVFYEAGPCGYALQRQMATDRIACDVIAPALMPRKPGERVKTNRRDARKLAELGRARICSGAAIASANRCCDAACTIRGGIYVKDASGGSPEERLLESRSVVMPSGWSQDGRYLVYTEVDANSRGDIWYLPDPLNASSARTPVKFQGTKAIEAKGQLSPDGRWLAYTSDESGQFEIYVRPFPSGPGRWKVSAGGARNVEPQWRRDGKELFFVENAF